MKRLLTDMRIFGKITWAIALPLLLSAMLCSCVKENLRPQDMPAEGESTVRLKFSSSDPEIVFTKATLNHKSENSIYNIFVFVFDGSGKRVYGHWFEEDAAVEYDHTGDGAYWHVDNSETDTTSGWVQFRCQNGTDMKIYLIANLDSDMVRISSDLLQYSILTEKDLLAAPVSLNQQVVSRNGYFLMTGKMDRVTIGEKDSGYYEISDVPLTLTRLDAKVRFKFVTGTRPDERGQVIKSFTPSQWKVVNVPAGSKLMDTDTDAVAVPSDAPTDDYPSYAGGFFDTPWINFEDFNTDGSTGFSFYMLENRQRPKRTCNSYNDRSRQLKDASGMNRSFTVEYTGADGAGVSREMLLFENANDFSTYVVVTGQVVMDLNNDDQGQTLNADVQYIIHLGDWGADIASAPGHWSDDRYSNFTNFYTKRNHSYTYTVTVNSVNNIRVEVESSQPGEEFKENQPGATGDVTVAKEEIAICDAHYESRTMTFHYRNFIQNGQVTVDDLTWRVSTPFSEGEPDRVNGQDVPTGLDYQWVHFRLNKKDESSMYYVEKRRKFTPRVFARSETMRTADENKEGDGTPGLAGYHNDGCMDVIAFVSYIKEQVKLYHTFQELGGENTSDFDSDNPADAKICVTVFVDEFYYDVNPITGVASQTLWKRFVNQPDRSLHILSNSSHSNDLESSATGSVITIRQKSIQCIYNTDSDYTVLQTAWGVEHVDEHEKKADGSLENWPYSYDNNTTSERNAMLLNGRYNTRLECGLDFGDGGANPQNDWVDYMDFEVENSTPQLNDAHRQLRYACLTRNRDNNGDGKIDRDEFRWYMAANKQLEGIFFGGGLLTASTRLYNRTALERTSDDGSVWRQHVVSSTKHGGSDSPTVYWAEEGLSTSSIQDDKSWTGTTSWSVRCVRNLGMDSDVEMGDDTRNVPQDYIEYYRQGDGSYIVTATHLNSSALRYYTSRELDFHNETSEENRLYRQFEVASASSSLGAYNSFSSSKDYIDSHLTNGICPSGYRFPNQMELAIMHSYLGIINSMSRTAWSMGFYAEDFGNTPKPDQEGKTGFRLLGSGNMTIDGGNETYEVRCVRDVR